MRLASRYLISMLGILASIMVLAAIAVLLFIRSDIYPKISRTHYDVLVSHRFELKNKSYDVVIVGDSSALVGIIPAIITTRLGDVTIGNLALVGYSTGFGYKLLLEHYLRKNKRPKLVILHLNAKNPWLHYSDDFFYERALIAYRYGDVHGIETFINLYPKSFLTLAKYQRHRLTSLDIDLTKSTYRDMLSELERTNGYHRNPAKGMDDRCSINSYVDIPRLSYISEIKSTLRAHNVPMVFVVAPMPTCEQAFEYFNRKYSAIVDMPLIKMRNRYFSDETHLTSDGAIAYSQVLGDHIHKWLTTRTEYSGVN